ncbi:hypothetical protein [Agathobaculum sp. Marseille-P7918]|uniref:hypothetical protein n=1 Tax=Agathobaculum sp. Marseille-P7918 TaxID=2479843 RepID=UPI00356632EC
MSGQQQEEMTVTSREGGLMGGDAALAPYVRSITVSITERNMTSDLAIRTL